MAARHAMIANAVVPGGTWRMPDVSPHAFGLPGAAEQHRIVVAMSGGVDSSLAAALVAGAGYETVGITLQLYDHGAATGHKGACCAGQDIADARAVAASIGIPHYVLNYESRFRQSVIDDFAESYLAGETPIPCVRCNQSVKFTDLLQTARELGAAALVTGHYVTSCIGEKGWQMFQAADTGRDQSYFLFATTQQQLNFLRFPLGCLQKHETRAMAAHFNLPVAVKPDSQDICFVPRGDYAGVIAKLRADSMEPGDVVHADGRTLGRHNGIVNFTIGQRKGLGVAVGEPLFVVSIDPQTRRVIVGPKHLLATKQLVLREVNWLGDDIAQHMAQNAVPVFVKVRSTQDPQGAALHFTADGAHVSFDEPQFGVAPGQACVFYDGKGGKARVLGGGIITKTLKPLA